ncbi:MAG: M20/M25/M40 family metallo-hydrolase [Treponema sp.]|nr:M20/M25/M40 family metallo-hydrolase [Treponema sp.]
MVNEKRIVGELFELVTIDSETKRERTIANALLKKLKDVGLENVHEDDSAGVSGCGAGNIFAYLKGNVPGVPAVLFNAHMDTVTPGVGVKPSINAEGNIVSDGSTVLGSDDKSGIAAIIEAIRVVQENKLPHGDIEVLITAGEESGLLGARCVDPKKLRAKIGYSLDTGGKVGSIKVKAPARKMLAANVYGTSAHAGVAPEKGVSAITVAAKALAAMPLGRIDSETTANIGVFKAESPTNIVCDRAFVEAEARSLDNAKLQKQADAMRKAFEDAAAEMGGRVELDIKDDCAAFNLSEGDFVVDVAQQAAARIGRPCELFAAGGASDANVLNGFGVPTAILACGYADVHSKAEWIPVKELVKLAEMTLAIIAVAAETAERKT